MSYSRLRSQVSRCLDRRNRAWLQLLFQMHRPWRQLPHLWRRRRWGTQHMAPVISLLNQRDLTDQTWITSASTSLPLHCLPTSAVAQSLSNSTKGSQDLSKSKQCHSMLKLHSNRGNRLLHNTFKEWWHRRKVARRRLKEDIRLAVIQVAMPLFRGLCKLLRRLQVMAMVSSRGGTVVEECHNPLISNRCRSRTRMHKIRRLMATGMTTWCFKLIANLNQMLKVPRNKAAMLKKKKKKVVSRRRIAIQMTSPLTAKVMTNRMTKQAKRKRTKKSDQLTDYFQMHCQWILFVFVHSYTS